MDDSHTAGICDIFDAARGGGRFWETTGTDRGRDRGVEAERSGAFLPPVWCPISSVSTFCLANKRKKNAAHVCFPPFDGLSVVSHFFLLRISLW